MVVHLVFIVALHHFTQPFFFILFIFPQSSEKLRNPQLQRDLNVNRTLSKEFLKEDMEKSWVVASRFMKIVPFHFFSVNKKISHFFLVVFFSCNFPFT